MPPFDGPRATLCVTRQPVNTRTEPSSIVVGIVTSTAFLHSPSTPTRSSSMPKVSATFRSCSCASRNGFSLRWLARCWSKAEAPFASSFFGPSALRPSSGLYREGDAGPARCTASRRPGDEPELVAAGRERRAGPRAPGDAELVGAGEQVALAREQPDECAGGGVEQHVEARDRLDLEARARIEPTDP